MSRNNPLESEEALAQFVKEHAPYYGFEIRKLEARADNAEAVIARLEAEIANMRAAIAAKDPRL